MLTRLSRCARRLGPAALLFTFGLGGCGDSGPSALPTAPTIPRPGATALGSPVGTPAEAPAEASREAEAANTRPGSPAEVGALAAAETTSGGASAGTSASVGPLTVNAASVAVTTANNGGSTEPAPGTPKDVSAELTSFSAAAVSPTSIRVSWQIEAEPANIEPTLTVQRRTGSESWGSVSVNASSGSKLDTGLDPSTTYQYRGKVTNPGSGVWWTVSATTTAVPIPGTPSPTASATSSSSITISWGSVNYATSYTVESQNGLGNKTVTGTSATYSGLAAGTRYCFKVKATNSSGSSDLSPERSARTPEPEPPPCTTTPSTPTGFRVSSTTTSSITLGWSAVTVPAECSVSYTVQEGSGSSYSDIKSGITGTSLTHRNLDADTRYCYRLNATSEAGNSGWTSPRCGRTDSPTPPPTPTVSRPTNLSATVVSASRIDLDWTGASGANSYDVRKSKNGSSWDTAENTGSSDSETSVTGLDANTLYYFQVRTVKGSQRSSYTSSVTATTLPPVPANLSGEAVSSTRIDLEWDAATGANSYDIRRSTDDSNWGSPVPTGTDEAHADTGLAADTTYYYQVRTVIGTRQSLWSDSEEITTLPAPPGGLTAAAVSESEISVDWNAVSGADGYELRQGTNGTTWGAEEDVGLMTDFSDTGLGANTTHYYQVRTVSGDLKSLWTAAVNATTLPPVPTGLTGTGTASSVTLDWDDMTGASGYEVQRSTDGSTWGTEVATAMGASDYSDTAVSVGNTYHYQVRTVIGTRRSLWSGTESVAVGNALAAPTSPAAEAVSATEIELTWEAAPGAHGYELRRSTDGSNWETEEDVGLVTEHNDDELDSRTTYHYQVRTVAGSQQSDWTPSVSAKTLPEVPGGLSATASTTQVDLEWEAVTDAESYEIQRRTGDGAWGLPVDTGSYTEHSDAGLDTNTTYGYQVRTVIGEERSLWSETEEVMTGMLPAPENIEATATSSFSVEVTWDAASGADSYEVFRSRDGLTIVRTETFFEDTDLRPEMNYSYQVRSVMGAMRSDWPELVTATTPAFEPPENFAGTSPTSTSIELTWDAVPGTGISYRIQRRQDGGNWSRFDTSDTSLEQDSLEQATEYEYQIRAVHGADLSPWSESLFVMTGEPPLAAPGGFEVEEEGAAYVDLSWDDFESGDGYTIERLGGGSLMWEVIADGWEETSYADLGLIPETDYQYRVRSERRGEVSEPTAAEDAMTTALGPPGNLAASAASSTSIEVSWDEERGGEMSYRIRRREVGVGGWAKRYTETTTSLTDEGLEPVIEYEYGARTIYRRADAVYRSSWSAVVKETTKPPEAPVPRVDGKTSTSVELEWSTVPDVVEYEIRRRVSPDGAWVSLGTFTGTAHTDDELTADTGYDYQARAFVMDARGRTLTSDWSESLTVTTDP